MISNAKWSEIMWKKWICAAIECNMYNINRERESCSSCGEIKKLTWIFHFFTVSAPHFRKFENHEIYFGHTQPHSESRVEQILNIFFSVVRGYMTFFYCNRFWFCILFLFKYEPQLWFSHSLFCSRCGGFCIKSQCHWDWKNRGAVRKSILNTGLFFGSHNVQYRT